MNVTKMTTARIDELTIDVQNGDQSWRKDVKERWAKFLEKTAENCDKKADELRSVGVIEDELVGYVRDAKKNRDIAVAVRAGTLGIDQVNSEIVMRASAVVGDP